MGRGEGGSANLRIPDLELHRWRSVIYSLEDDRLRPLPGRENSEEATDDAGSKSGWVELTYPSRQHRPGDSSQETINVGVDGSSC
jgi:hypothetical protein